jgi:hypothetical protein
MNPSKPVSLLMFLSAWSLALIYLIQWVGVPTLEFVFIYIVYIFGLILCLHSALFLIRDEFGLSKNVPRYLDYAYTAIVSLALIQILFSSEAVVNYSTYLADDDQLVNRIRLEAQQHRDDGCKRPDETLYSVQFCNVLRDIAIKDDLKSHLLNTVARDKQFMNHPTHITQTILGITITTPLFFDTQKRYVTPINDYIRQLVARNAFLAPAHKKLDDALFSWLGLILLPLGIALRIVKTSVELFGLDNDKAKPQEPPQPAPIEGAEIAGHAERSKGAF